MKFTSPVLPGDALETHVWEVGPGPNGTTEVTFFTKDVATGKVRDFSLAHGGLLLTFYQVAFGEGIAYIKKGEKSKL